MDLSTRTNSLTKKQRFWLNHIQSAQSQGLSLSRYASQHDLSLKALYNWRWLLKRKGLMDNASPQPFVPVVQQPIIHRPRPLGGQAQLHLRFANDTQVDLTIEPAQLSAVLAMVKAL